MTAMEDRRLIGIEPEFGHARQHLFIENLQLDAREMRAEATVRADAKGDVDIVFAVEIIDVGLRKFLGVIGVIAGLILLVL